MPENPVRQQREKDERFLPGAVLWLGPDAGIQWRIRPIAFLLVRVLDLGTWWAGTVYLDGYEVDDRGVAAARRTAFVIREGVKLLPGMQVRHRASGGKAQQPEDWRRDVEEAIRLVR